MKQKLGFIFRHRLSTFNVKFIMCLIANCSGLETLLLHLINKTEAIDEAVDPILNKASSLRYCDLSGYKISASNGLKLAEKYLAIRCDEAIYAKKSLQATEAVEDDVLIDKLTKVTSNGDQETNCDACLGSRQVRPVVKWVGDHDEVQCEPLGTN